MAEAHLRVFRGEAASEGRFEEFDVPVEEGMVVLDALHWIQGHEAPDLAVRWNCKAAKCGSCSAEVDGRPSLMCKTRLSDFDLERADHRRADARLPAHPRPRHRRLLELRGQQDHPAVHAARRRAPGGLALAAGGHRAGPGIPQVHRVLPVPGRLPRAAQPRDRAAVHGPALPGPHGRAGDAPDRPGGPPRRTSRRAAASATATSPSAAPRSARSTSGSPTTRSSRSRSASPTQYYDPLQWVWRKLRGGGRVRPAPGRSCRCCRPARTGPAESPDDDTAGPPDARDRADDPDGPPTLCTDGETVERPATGRGRAGPRPLTEPSARSGFARSAPTAPPAATPGRRRSARRSTTSPAPMRATHAPSPDASISDYLGVQTNNVAEYTGRGPGARAGA